MSTIRSELLELQMRDPQRMLHVNKVWEWAAEHPESQLYRAIEWDVEKAAREYQFQQIRKLIILHVVNEDTTPMMVSLSIDRVQGGGYRPIDDVVKVPDLRQVLLEDALRELGRLQARYQRVQALASVWEEADRARIEAEKRKPQPKRRRG